MRGSGHGLGRCGRKPDGAAVARFERPRGGGGRHRLARAVRAAAAANHVEFRLERVGLAPGKSITLEWALYPLSAGEDYWTFINRIREDWNVNFRPPGPADMLHLFRDRYWNAFRDDDALRTFLTRSDLKVVQLLWLDFNHHNWRTGELVSRPEFKRIMRRAKTTAEAVDPNILIVGNTEAPYVSLPRPLCQELQAASQPDTLTSYSEFTPAQMEILNRSPQSWERWKDSVIWSADGRAQRIYYTRHHADGTLMPMFALTVYPVVGNGQHEFMMEQARFILEEVGLDGVYIDSYTSHMYSYDAWDGTTVDIDPATGKIARRYTDCTVAGAESRRQLIEYILTAGKVCIINGHAVARETRSLGAIRFDEMFSQIDPLSIDDGEKPPLVGKLCYAHLSSPVGLGFRPDTLGDRGRANYARVIVKAAISYLRHGVLYHHYETLLPETGPGSGEYGPFNHMYPITPVRLGPGFVEGRERTVTCVSREFMLSGAREPRILLFDITGRPKAHAIAPVRTDDGWRVSVAIADWREIAVLETVP